MCVCFNTDDNTEAEVQQSIYLLEWVFKQRLSGDGDLHMAREGIRLGTNKIWIENAQYSFKKASWKKEKHTCTDLAQVAKMGKFPPEAALICNLWTFGAEHTQRQKSEAEWQILLLHRMNRCFYHNVAKLMGHMRQTVSWLLPENSAMCLPVDRVTNKLCKSITCMMNWQTRSD